MTLAKTLYFKPVIQIAHPHTHTHIHLHVRTLIQFNTDVIYTLLLAKYL